MTAPDPDRQAPPRDLPGLAAFAGLGLSIAITVGVFVALGLWVDELLSTAPAFLIAGIVLGCAAAVASTVVLAKRYL